jgi:hypothetical protein
MIHGFHFILSAYGFWLPNDPRGSWSNTVRKFSLRKNCRKPSPWERNHWCPFIRSEQPMRTAIRYVEANPVKAGLRPQRWSLVTPYDP